VNAGRRIRSSRSRRILRQVLTFGIANSRPGPQVRFGNRTPVRRAVVVVHRYVREHRHLGVGRHRVRRPPAFTIKVSARCSAWPSSRGRHRRSSTARR
jgi:hypothetical protein